MKITDKKVIIREAIYFYNVQIKDKNISHSLINKIKIKLADFYTPESKALFLNTIEENIQKNLEQQLTEKALLQTENKISQIANINHYIIKRENLLFYIQQELDTLPLFDISQRLDELLAKATTENKNISDNQDSNNKE